MTYDYDDYNLVSGEDCLEELEECRYVELGNGDVILVMGIYWDFGSE